jgi:hypothetical protein
VREDIQKKVRKSAHRHKASAFERTEKNGDDLVTRHDTLEETSLDDAVY